MPILILLVLNQHQVRVEHFKVMFTWQWCTENGKVCFAFFHEQM